MKIKGSITIQVFLTLLFTFMIVLGLQTLFLGNFFLSFYNYSMLQDIQKEFSRTARNFSGVSEEGVNGALREYSIRHQSPVLVFTENYRILDRYFFDQLSLLTLRDEASRVYRLPVDDLLNLDSAYVFEQFYIEASPLGESGFYDPTLIQSDKKTYYIRHSYNSDREGRTITIDPVRGWFLQQGGGQMKDRAWLIYNRIKDCLILRTDIPTHLDEMTRAPFSDRSGTNYYFISHSQKINGVTTYFLTLRPIILTGSEARYFSRYFSILFSFLSFILISAAFMLSRRLSSPILKLSAVTQRLADRDFSVRSSIHSRNEIGRLSTNINLLANNLENAISVLQQSAEAARYQETRMRHLLANIAHEFKTPLGIISLYIELIEKGLFEKEPAHYYRIIDHEIENLTQMIDDAIQFTKMQAGYLECNPAPVELNDLIETVLNRFAEKLEKEQFTLQVHSEDVTVMADGRRIEQVLTNLISNGIKYSNEIKRIEIATTREGEGIVIHISNYCEVSDEDLNRIWERYYRASGEKTMRLPSQGIGLEIVRGILELHKSRFGVKHDADKITFFFSLPRAGEERLSSQAT